MERTLSSTRTVLRAPWAVGCGAQKGCVCESVASTVSPLVGPLTSLRFSMLIFFLAILKRSFQKGPKTLSYRGMAAVRAPNDPGRTAPPCHEGLLYSVGVFTCVWGGKGGRRRNIHPTAAIRGLLCTGTRGSTLCSRHEALSFARGTYSCAGRWVAVTVTRVQMRKLRLSMWARHGT